MSAPIRDEGAELGAMAALFAGHTKTTAVLAELEERDFTSEAFQAIFAAAKALAAAAQPIDAFTVTSELERTNKLDRAGGRAAVFRLDNAPVADHPRSYVARLREKSALRRFANEAARLAEAAASAPDGSAFLKEASSSLLGAMVNRGEGPKQSSDWAARYWTELERRSQAKEGPRLSTGLWCFDHVHGKGAVGGLRRGSMVVIAARPGCGKTSLGLNLARSMSRSARHVFFASLEMTEEECIERLTAIDCGVDSQALSDPRGLGAEDWPRIGAFLRRVADESFTIWAPPEAHIATLRLQVLAEHARRPLDLVVVDYLQLIRASGATREQEVAVVSRALKALAKEVAAPIVVLCQLNREIERRVAPRKKQTLRTDERDRGTPPKASDLRESGSIEQDADSILIMTITAEESQKANAQIVDAWWVKDRFGARRDYELTFIPAIQKFED